VKKPLGLGLCGAGRFGAFSLAAYAELAEVGCVAVADEDVARAAAIAPPGAAAYGDYRALLDDPRVDLVAITTPPLAHGRMAVEAASAGRHVFVEKPLATTLEEGRAAVEAARRAGVRLGIDYVLRHHPLHRLALRLVRSGVLGGLLHWSLENYASLDPIPATHWFWDRRVSGGIHVEHGVHFFDLCNQAADGLPDGVSGGFQRAPDGRADRAWAQVTYGDRLAATFYHAFVRTGATEQTTIRLGFERGEAILEGWIPVRLAVRLEAGDAPAVDALRELFGTVERRREALLAEAVAPDRQGEYRRAIQSGMRDLVAAIREECDPEVTPHDALHSLEIALRASPEDRSAAADR
jgi:predicted dehydrogenase